MLRLWRKARNGNYDGRRLQSKDGKTIETISESDFRAWAAAGPVREEALGNTKPQTLKSIVNPIRLIEALKK